MLSCPLSVSIQRGVISAVHGLGGVMGTMSSHWNARGGWSQSFKRLHLAEGPRGVVAAGTKGCPAYNGLGFVAVMRPRRCNE